MMDNNEKEVNNSLVLQDVSSNATEKLAKILNILSVSNSSLLSLQKAWEEVQLMEEYKNLGDEDQYKVRAWRRKLKATRIPESIFLPKNMVSRIYLVDRIIATIREKAGVSLSIDQAKEHMKTISEITTSLWNFVFKLSPKLAIAGFDPRRWSEINDSYEIKVVKANRKKMGYVIPRTEESGQIAMGLRLISENILIAKYKSPFDEIEGILKEYASLMESFSLKLKDIATKVKVEDNNRSYRSKRKKMQA